MSDAHSHVVPPRVYVTIFLALMALTALTTWVAYIDLGLLNVVIMLAIAGLKASLVVLWFMHARYESQLTRVTILDDNGRVFGSTTLCERPEPDALRDQPYAVRALRWSVHHGRLCVPRRRGAAASLQSGGTSAAVSVASEHR